MLNSKAEATGIIHTSWVFHKVDLLQMDVDEIHILAEQVYTPKQIEAQLKAVDKNMKRTVMARLAINEANRKLKEADTNSKRLMRELKKAQDALKKAMAKNVKIFTSLRQNCLIKLTLTTPVKVITNFQIMKWKR